jgi:hypothetical protein
MIFASRELRRP